MGLNYFSGSVAVGQTMSRPFNLGENKTPVGITTGSNITGTALTFLVSNDNVTYVSLYDETSTEVSLTITTAARGYALPLPQTWPWKFMKVRLGTSASSVAQTLVTTNFTLVTRAI